MPPGLREGFNPPSLPWFIQIGPFLFASFADPGHSAESGERKVVMPRSLPTNPSVRFLQVEAKSVIKTHKSGDVACCATLRYHFRFSRAEDDEILRAKVSLQEAQHALALDYGFRSWTDLTNRAADLSKTDLPEGTGVSADNEGDVSAIKLVNHIISQSVRARASDIHIEPLQDGLKIRYRVDGILSDFPSPSESVEPSLISRIKAMARMDIAENKLPQDGRLNVKIGEQEIDVRASTIPTALGERAVLRLLSKSTSLLKLPELGLSPERIELLTRLVSSPNGIILVSGASGSGKTTTLYGILESIRKPGINIMTIEDPVEYLIGGISQIQVNPKSGLTFAAGLRSIVRQDPDVILIGEIRDSETAGIAIQASLTGHLVFSTLHTNDAASTIARLIDMGVEPFLVSSAVTAVVAQRLVRVLCSDCKEPFTPEGVTLESLGITADQLKGNTLFRANGCEKCGNSGYRGRMGLFEIMVLDDALKSLILQTHDAGRLKSEALTRKMTTLRQDGIQKVIDGTTTIEEALRATQDYG